MWLPLCCCVLWRKGWGNEALASCRISPEVFGSSPFALDFSVLPNGEVRRTSQQMGRVERALRRFQKPRQSIAVAAGQVASPPSRGERTRKRSRACAWQSCCHETPVEKKKLTAPRSMTDSCRNASGSAPFLHESERARATPPPARAAVTCLWPPGWLNTRSSAVLVPAGSESLASYLGGHVIDGSFVELLVFGFSLCRGVLLRIIS